ncbi:MAG TPA: hypothetical protein VFC19_24195 [Candidatus Limnocylindrales bacterium]|nr:hypothetical protein [Candidatus Limnocylindrales bacterium]
MVTRRMLLGGTATAGILTFMPKMVHAANGWAINPEAITTHRVPGSAATVDLLPGVTATILIHIARRWHYEIAPLDTGEGGGIAGLSGTAIALHPTAYPPGGSEWLWPHHRAIVVDILADCDGTVLWGGHLSPAAVSHFHIAVPPHSKALAVVAGRLETGRHTGFRRQTAGAVADPRSPERQRRLARGR